MNFKSICPFCDKVCTMRNNFTDTYCENHPLLVCLSENKSITIRKYEYGGGGHFRYEFNEKSSYILHPKIVIIPKHFICYLNNKEIIKLDYFPNFTPENIYEKINRLLTFL